MPEYHISELRLRGGMVERHLLINITVAWAPSEHLIVTPGTVDSRLGVNCQETKLVDLSQLLRDN